MRTLAIILFAAACTGSGEVRYSAQAEVTTPELVEVEPGVQVVADYDEPVFYNDGFYWRYYGGVWYRSPQYNRAWVRVETVPVAVRRIERPERFVHYRAQGRVEARDHREGPQPGPDVRDHRVAPPGPPPGQERREEAREHREEVREERHDAHEVARDRAEVRHDQKEVERDHREIERDKARGDQKELERDRREEKRDQREEKHDRKELEKDRKDKDKKH